ncbi:Gldg family protein [Aestuariibacter sp. A3R04]|nr:Gldg family protein [Aestuariibacter sp. A3R04]
MRKVTVLFSLFLLFVSFVFLVFINNQLASRYRVDLTENAVYSLSPGSKKVLMGLEEPITLYFFFSNSSTTGMTKLRNYASRIESLLNEYVQASNGQVNLKVIDPVPFSEAEDLANQFGLTGAAIGHLGEDIYFGLAGTNLVDDTFSIPFFDQKNEQFLEYDISKLVYQLSEPDTMTLALITDLPVAGGQDPITGQYTGPMVFYQQLAQLYNIHIVSREDKILPEDTDLVMLLHPQELSDSLLYSIDQFAMHGGSVLAFLDPHYEADPYALLPDRRANASTFPLLKAWGVQVGVSDVVLDAQLGLDVRSQDGTVTKHFGLIGLTANQLDRNDVTTANLDSINGSGFGVLYPVSKSGLVMEPLMQSSMNAGLTNANDYAMTQEPVSLQRGFGGNTTAYILAARYSGSARSYFERPASEGPAARYVEKTDDLNLIVVMDADLLSDKYWIQKSSFYGDTLLTPFANNGDFLVNSVENLIGSNALISIRARGSFARPFRRVNELEVKAEEKFREQERRLQLELVAVEETLQELQAQQGHGGAIVFSEQQQLAIEAQVQKRVAIRQKLRKVRYELEREIDRLGEELKIANIVIAPAVLLSLLYLFSILLKRRPGKQYTGEDSA